MTIRYCIREVLLLGRQTANRARINDEVWTAVKRLGVNKPVRAGKSSKILERRWAPPDSDSKPMNRLCKMHHSKTAIPDRSKPRLPRTTLITTNLQGNGGDVWCGMQRCPYGPLNSYGTEEEEEEEEA